MNTIKQPYFSEEKNGWVVESHSDRGDFAGVNISVYSEKKYADGDFNLSVNKFGYQIVGNEAPKSDTEAWCNEYFPLGKLSLDCARREATWEIKNPGRTDYR